MPRREQGTSLYDGQEFKEGVKSGGAPSRSRTRCSGTRVASLDALGPHLRTLKLINTPVADLSALAGLHDLEELWLDNTGVADVAPLAGLPKLRRLSLSGTRVADLSALAGLEALEWLNAGQTAADTAALERPGLEILR